MKWLIWGKTDFKHGLGGVEVHGRTLARELEKLGIEVTLSNDRRDLFDRKWDVLHTHGSAFSIPLMLRWKERRSIEKLDTLWLHTLHGTTLGRMRACREWRWIRGYTIAAAETLFALECDLLASIHPELHLCRLRQQSRKPLVVCGNGWDSWQEGLAELPPSLSEPGFLALRSRLQSFKPFWLVIGRGHDAVKAFERVHALLQYQPSLRVLAVPGDGFVEHPQVICSGVLDAEQIRFLLSEAEGLLLTSKYEGLPLVVLEALAMGVPVVAPKVGGLSTLKAHIEGLSLVVGSDVRAYAQAIVQAGKWDRSLSERMARAQVNRKYLLRWEDVAQTLRVAVRALRKKNDLQIEEQSW